jgi:xanthine dehydrogenase YagS FAD-binding subunit
MQAFEWANAATVDDAVKLLSPAGKVDPDEMPRPMGGGQDLLTTMKSYITRPPRVVNLKTIGGLDTVDTVAGGLKIGALVTLTDLAAHPAVVQAFPGLVDAVHSIATPQIRNLGTVGGNLGQRPRCWYFRLDNVKCLKRGGDTCYAIDGENKYHAIFDTDKPCVMVHSSDLAPMLTAADAAVVVHGPAGTRTVPISQFFLSPTAETVRVENVLKPGEVISDITVPRADTLGRSVYIKFKERESLDFAMASVAAVARMTGNQIGQIRLVLGGVAQVPWPLPDVEAFLLGKTMDEATANQAGELAVKSAKPLSQNKYKLRLVKTLVRRALLKACDPKFA